MIIYTVRPGDTLSKIAARFGVNADTLAADNWLTSENLSVGQSLAVAYRAKTHEVTRDETLRQIAQRYGTSVERLLRNNPRLNGLEPRDGDVLTVSFAGEKLGRIRVVGYVYTFVDETVLRRTLPYLTTLAIFSYGIRSDGSLTAPDDSRLISLAKEYGTRPMLVLTSLGEDGTFSSERVSAILNDSSATERLISELVSTVRRKGYDAVSVDLEYISAADRDLFSEFVTELSVELHKYGRTVEVCLAPKTSDSQPGLLYEGLDYEALGAAADSLFLMTYEWGYAYSEPRAVAPINIVSRVVEYAKGVIPREKLRLGMPNYGYDWQLPWVEGVAAKSLANADAIELSNEFGGEIFYDELAATPWFRYYDERGERHEVWFEDARSVRSKLRLAHENQLGGIGIWNVTRWFGQLWFVLNQLFEVEKSPINSI